MNEYELHWQSHPMGEINNFEGNYDVGGVYMFVMHTTNGGYVGYYIGEAKNIGNRWWDHTHKNGGWFCNPHEGFYIPNCADDFLKNPVDVLNNGALATGLPDRNKTVARMVERTWFTFAEVSYCLPKHDKKQTLRAIEYVLQEALKMHLHICVKEEIGDSNNRTKPVVKLKIKNHFRENCMMETLQSRICYDPKNSTVSIE